MSLQNLREILDCRALAERRKVLTGSGPTLQKKNEAKTLIIS